MGSITDRNYEHNYRIEPMCLEPTYGIKILETQILNVGFCQPNFYNIEDKMKMTDQKMKTTWTKQAHTSMGISSINLFRLVW